MLLVNEELGRRGLLSWDPGPLFPPERGCGESEGLLSVDLKAFPE